MKRSSVRIATYTVACIAMSAIVACGGARGVDIKNGGKGGPNATGEKASDAAKKTMRAVVENLSKVKEKNLGPKAILDAMNGVISNDKFTSKEAQGEARDLVFKMTRLNIEHKSGDSKLSIEAEGKNEGVDWLQMDSSSISNKLAKIGTIKEKKKVEVNNKKKGKVEEKQEVLKNKELWGLCLDDCQAVLLFITEKSTVLPIYLRNYSIDKIESELKIVVTDNLYKVVEEEAKKQGPDLLKKTESLEYRYQIVAFDPDDKLSGFSFELKSEDLSFSKVNTRERLSNMSDKSLCLRSEQSDCSASE